MRRPADMPAYIRLVEQALDEIIDLRAAVEHDATAMDKATELVDRLESELREHLREVRQPHYLFGDGGDLRFMDIVDSAPRSLLPFARLLHLINETHRKGLEPDQD